MCFNLSTLTIKMKWHTDADECFGGGPGNSKSWILCYWQF